MRFNSTHSILETNHRMVMGKVKDSKITDEENKIRQEEDKLFEKMKAPPSKLEELTDIIGDTYKSDLHQPTKKKKQ